MDAIVLFSTGIKIPYFPFSLPRAGRGQGKGKRWGWAVNGLCVCVSPLKGGHTHRHIDPRKPGRPPAKSTFTTDQDSLR